MIAPRGLRQADARKPAERVRSRQAMRLGRLRAAALVGKRATAGAGHGAARAGPGLGASVRVSMETHPRRRWTPASWHRSLATRGGTVRARRVHIHSPALARTCSSTATINSEDPLPRDSPDTSLSPQKFTR